LTSAQVGGAWSASRQSRFTPGEKAPGNHCKGGWVGPEPVWTTWKRANYGPYPDSNSEPSVIQPVASRSTDYVIPVLCIINMNKRMNTIVLWYVAPRSLLEIYWRFEGMYHHHLQGRRVSQESRSHLKTSTTLHHVTCKKAVLFMALIWEHKIPHIHSWISCSCVQRACPLRTCVCAALHC
jgi:hypothetical protein